MDRQTIDSLKSKICRELDDYAQQQLSANNVEMIHHLTSSLKNLFKIEMAEEYGDRRSGEYRNGYSREYYPNDSSGEYVRAHYRDGNSYAYNGGGYGSGRSGSMRDELDRMISQASNDHEKELLMRARDAMRN